MSLTTTQRFSFTPGPHPDPEDPEPVPRFMATITTLLKGVRTWDRSQGGLWTRLTIAFAQIVETICARATFASITPGGHAPLVLTSASYLGSTCYYVDPAVDDPLVVYLDDPDADAILKIGFPATNLYSYFGWPDGVVVFDPDIAPTEQKPPLWFGIDQFSSPSADPDDQRVQLPMRLAFEIDPDPLDPKPTTVMVRELTYEDAPKFSASPYQVTCTSDDVPIELTAPEIADALVNAGYADGVYDLYWRIYRGAGDMIYRARCIESDLGTQMDRILGIGGGFGFELDTDLLAARIQVENKPFPFLINTVGVQYNVGSTGVVRQPTPTIPAGSRTWLGSDPATTVLTWTIDMIYCGRFAVEASGTVRCACLVTDENDEECIQVYLSDSAIERMVLRPNQEWTTVKLVATPSWSYAHPAGGTLTITPATANYAFSQDGSTLLCYASHKLISGKLAPAAVWETDLIPEVGWTRIYENDIYSTIETSGTEDANHEGGTCAGNAMAFLHAGYRAGVRIIQEAKATLTLAYHADYTNDEITTPVNVVLATPLGDLYVRRQTPPEEWTLSYERTGNISDDEDVDIAIIENGNSVRTVKSVSRHLTHQWTENSAFAGSTYGECYPNVWIYLDPASPGDPCCREEDENDCFIVDREDAYNGYETSYRRLIGVPRNCNAELWARYYHQTEGQDPDGTVRILSGDDEVISRAANAITPTPTTWPIYPVQRADAHYHETETRTQLLTTLDDAINKNGASEPYLWDARTDNTTIAGYVYAGNAIAIGVVTPDHIYDITGSIPTAMQLGSIRITGPRSCLYHPDPDATLPSGDPRIPPSYSDLLDAINLVRTTNGATELTEDSALVTATAIHSQWMVDHSSVTEIGLNDSTPLDRAKMAGYKGAVLAEIRGTTAITVDPIDAIINDWLGVPSTASIILNPVWTRIGGYVIPWEGTGSIACVNFGVEVTPP